MSETIFPSTASLRSGVELLNGLDPKRLAAVSSRILTNLISRARKSSSNPMTANASDSTSSTAVAGSGSSDQIFSAAEIVQLTEVFSLDSTQLDVSINFLLYLFELAIYHSLSQAKLRVQLEGIGLKEDIALSISTIWDKYRDEYLSSSRDQSLAPLILDSVNWRLQLNLASDRLANQKNPVTLVELGFANNSSSQSNTAESRIQFELNASGLEKLYEKCELIQKQLDSLTEK